MRFRLGRKSVRMHQGAFLTFFCIITAQSLISETYGQRSIRLRTTTTTPTTSTPYTSQPSSELSTSLPAPPSNAKDNPNPTNPLPPPKRRRKIRVKKLRVAKRQGPLSDDVDIINSNQGGVREPLYQDHADEYHTPDHYYSPIRRQRMRGNRKLFTTRVQNVQQESHKSLEESPSNMDVRNNKRRRYPLVIGDESSEEYAPPTQTQPTPKNYAFAYAVRDEDNTDDNHFSHKEARDGKLTMGEYRINLPDGRIQVVRYTAGGDIGYKADVTYEGEGDDHPKKPELTAKPTPFTAGNSGYLPPSLSSKSSSEPSSYGSPSTSRPPKKYRKKQRNRYQKYVTPTTPTLNYNKYQEEEDFGNLNHYGNSQFLSPSSDRNDPDKYDGPQYYSSRPGSKPRSQPSSTPRPIQRRPTLSINYDGYLDSPDTPPSPTVHTSSKGVERERRPTKPSSSSASGRQNKYSHSNAPVEEEYEGNLAFLHDQSPRAGPSGQKKKKNGNGYSNVGGYSNSGRDKNEGSPSSIGDYGYPGHHPEIQEDIHTLKQSYKSQKPIFNNGYHKENFKPQQRRRTSPKPETSPAALYNEPGPGNYYTAINGLHPSSPSPSSRPQQQFPKYPKPVYRSPTPTQRYNYIDDSDDQHHQNYEDEDGHQNQRYNQDVENGRGPTPPTAYDSYTPISFKSGKSKGLIPIEDFKAGPTRKTFFKTKNTKNPEKQRQSHKVVDHFYDDPSTSLRAGPSNKQNLQQESVAYKEPYHYYNSQHPSYHHGGYIPPTPGPKHQQTIGPSPSPATSYTIDFPGGQHSFYLKTGPGSLGKSKSSSSSLFKEQTQQQFIRQPQSTQYQSPYSQRPQTQTSSPQRKKTSSGNGSGLVFFETPGIGPRPSQGVKNVLSQFPTFPGSSPSPPESFPNTIVHNYEVGAKDYGEKVSYKNSFNTPSSGEGNADHHSEQGGGSGTTEQDPNSNPSLSRDYLFDNGPELLGENSPSSPPFRSTPTSPSPAQFHYEKVISPSPASLPFTGSTPESFQDIDYHQLLAPESPTPAISTSHFHQPIRTTFETDFGVDPRHSGGGKQHLLGFSTIREEDALNFNAESPEGGTYQYQQYEDNVK